jgi:hypothetical protein
MGWESVLSGAVDVEPHEGIFAGAALSHSLFAYFHNPLDKGRDAAIEGLFAVERCSAQGLNELHDLLRLTRKETAAHPLGHTAGGKQGQVVPDYLEKA